MPLGLDEGKLRAVKIAALAVLIAGLALFISGLDFSAVKIAPSADLIIILAAFLIVFSLSRALSMKYFFADFGFNLSLAKSVEMHFVSAFAEIASFTGKIGSDVAKYFYLEGKGKRKTGVIAFRVLATYCYGIVFLAMLFALTENFLAGAALAFSIVLPLALKKKAEKMLGVESVSGIIISAAFYTLSVISSLGVAWIVISVYSHEKTLETVFSYFYAHIAGILSTLPFGLGVEEGFIISSFSGSFTAEQIAAIILLIRLSTVVPGSLIGALMYAEQQ